MGGFGRGFVGGVYKALFERVEGIGFRVWGVVGWEEWLKEG